MYYLCEKNEKLKVSTKQLIYKKRSFAPAQHGLRPCCWVPRSVVDDLPSVSVESNSCCNYQLNRVGD